MVKISLDELRYLEFNKISNIVSYFKFNVLNDNSLKNLNLNKLVEYKEKLLEFREVINRFSYLSFKNMKIKFNHYDTDVFFDDDVLYLNLDYHNFYLSDNLLNDFHKEMKFSSIDRLYSYFIYKYILIENMIGIDKQKKLLFYILNDKIEYINNLIKKKSKIIEIEDDYLEFLGNIPND